MKYFFLLFCLMGYLCGCATNGEPRPPEVISQPKKTELEVFYQAQFQAHPAQTLNYSKKAELKWRTLKKARRYQTFLTQSWSEAKEPNFAGHFFVVPGIGCGTGCSVIFVIDWNTGKIVIPPEDHSYEIKKDSRLMVLKPYSECTAYGPPILLDFDGTSFKVVQHSHCANSF